MTDPERREPQFPIATVEYGPEQILRLQEYCKEAEVYLKKLKKISMEDFKTPAADDLNGHKNEMLLLHEISQNIANQLKSGSKIIVSKRAERVSFTTERVFTPTDPSFPLHRIGTEMSASQFSKILNILWPTEYLEDSGSEVAKSDVCASLLIHGRATLKPSA